MGGDYSTESCKHDLLRFAAGNLLQLFLFFTLYNIIKSMPYFMPGVFVAVDTRRVMWKGGGEFTGRSG